MNVFFSSRSAPTLSHESIASGGEESESGEWLEAIGLLLLSRMNKFDRRRNAPIVDRYEQHFSPVRLTCSNGRISPRLWRGRTVEHSLQSRFPDAVPCHAMLLLLLLALLYNMIHFCYSFSFFPSSSSEFLDEILHCLNGEGCCTRNESGCVF